MEKYMRNETISLGRIPSIGTETVECQLNLIKSENVVTPHFLSFSKKEHAILQRKIFFLCARDQLPLCNLMIFTLTRETNFLWWLPTINF